MTLQDWFLGFAGASALEWIATLAGLLCVGLLIRRNIWTWGLGLIQVTLYVYIFWQAKLYADMILNAIYIVLQGYGWWAWAQHKDHTQEIMVEWGTLPEYLLWIGVALVGAIGMGWLLTHTEASLPYPDSFILSTSLVAQWLLTQRRVFNWAFWIAVDGVAIGVYLQKGLYPTTLLYTCFLVMASVGQWAWWQRYKAQLTPSTSS
ncbi:MAG: hypothetical protein RLZZ422_2231 [Pseudomonadota bacterium]|jgi:nicotinamide mononucleotide transporter